MAYWKRIPVGARFALCALLLAAVLLPFRTPSLSQGYGQTYYQRQGDNAEIVANSPPNIKTTLEYNGHALDVDAAVHGPGSDTIGVYLGAPHIPDMEQVQACLFPEDAEFDVSVSRRSVYPLYYDSAITTYASEYGSMICMDDGYVMISCYEPAIEIADAEDARQLLLQLGYPAENAQIDSNAEGGYTVTSTMQGIEVSHNVAFDEYTGLGTDGIHLTVKTQDGCFAGLNGSFWYPVETLWENTQIVSAADAVALLWDEIFLDGAYTDIHFRYHGRSVYGNPAQQLFYPVWEFTNRANPAEFTISNAITGACEAMVLSDAP